jgi:hypothetical protein
VHELDIKHDKQRREMQGEVYGTKCLEKVTNKKYKDNTRKER